MNKDDDAFKYGLKPPPLPDFGEIPKFKSVRPEDLGDLGENLEKSRSPKQSSFAKANRGIAIYFAAGQYFLTIAIVLVAVTWGADALARELNLSSAFKNVSLVIGVIISAILFIRLTKELIKLATKGKDELDYSKSSKADFGGYQFKGKRRD